MPPRINPRLLPPHLRALAKTPAPRKPKATKIPDSRWEQEGLPIPVREFKFHPVRKWRIDFCWPEIKLALECEGGVWSGGRHTRGSGFLKDIAKYNEITLAGFRLLRCTPQMIKSGDIFEVLRRAINERCGA